MRHGHCRVPGPGAISGSRCEACQEGYRGYWTPIPSLCPPVEIVLRWGPAVHRIEIRVLPMVGVRTSPPGHHFRVGRLPQMRGAHQMGLLRVDNRIGRPHAKGEPPPVAVPGGWWLLWVDGGCTTPIDPAGQRRGRCKQQGGTQIGYIFGWIHGIQGFGAVHTTVGCRLRETITQLRIRSPAVDRTKTSQYVIEAFMLFESPTII